MEHIIDLINKQLLEYVNKIEDSNLKEVIHYALFPGGKRLRPLILLSILEDLNLDLESGINQAIAIEMIHNYSLIHDDIPAMDNDDYRRGRLTVHKKFGEAIAILAGDALLTDAFFYFSLGDISASQKLEIIQLASLNSGGNGMVYGQVLDIDANAKRLSLDEVKKIHFHKTRDLLHLAFISAGIIAKLDANKLNELTELANYFGLAFQLKDYIDDYSSENSDLKNQKATYPSLIGLEASKKLLDEYKTKCLEICKNILGERSLYKLIERIL